ncbi:MAG TPA: hypothetical protein VFN13_00190 [Rudaea sp.]|nr:hypothetical protein [Rudaea sp.]
MDISEPSYMIVVNGTDYVLKNNQWVIPSGNDPQSEALTSIQVCGGSAEIFASTTPGLPIAHVVRLAALRDFSLQDYSLSVVGADTMYRTNKRPVVG